jgi:hypothetical protein
MPLTIDDVRKLYWTEPFQPFKVCLDDGREVVVSERLHIALDPTGHSVALALPDETIDIVDVERITGLKPARRKPVSRTKKGKRKQP